jgi:hypothetical protein
MIWHCFSLWRSTLDCKFLMDGVGRLIVTTGVSGLSLLLFLLLLGSGSVVGIATGYGLDDPGIETQSGVGSRFSAPVQTDPGAHPASCTMGIVSFRRVKSSRGVTLTPHLLVSWLWKGRATPLLLLKVLRPVQNLSACTRVHFTLLLLLLKYIGLGQPSLKSLNTELNPFCHLLALLGAHHILHISRIRVN